MYPPPQMEGYIERTPKVGRVQKSLLYKPLPPPRIQDFSKKFLACLQKMGGGGLDFHFF